MLKKLARVLLPVRLRKRLNYIRKIRRIIKSVGFKRYCPVCQHRSSHFLDFDLRPLHGENGIIPPIVVPDTRCPWCGSHVHHRLMWTVLPELLGKLTSSTGEDRVRILHFAPERFSVPRLQKLQNVEYITTDFMRDDVHVKLDMCEIGLAEECINLVIASHVLEHVPNDISALNELFRILRPGGQIILLVPILAEQSFEHDNVTTDAERLSMYGQKDHVRAYGIDLVDRIASCGFEVEIIRSRDFKDLNHLSYLLDVQGILFLGRKPVEWTVPDVQA